MTGIILTGIIVVSSFIASVVNFKNDKIVLGILWLIVFVFNMITLCLKVTEYEKSTEESDKERKEIVLSTTERPVVDSTIVITGKDTTITYTIKYIK